VTARRPRRGGDGPLLGTVLSLPEPALAELAAQALDVAWIDLEHGALGAGDVPPLAIAVQGAGCAAFVRLPRTDSELLPAVLDAGVDGVVAPRVDGVDEALELVDRLRYPPGGTRGYGPRRSGGYGRSSPPARVACHVQIETPAGVEAAEAVARVDGVDALVVGCADLSFALGRPHELRTPEMRAAVERVQDAARRAGIAAGVAGGGDPEAIAELAGPDVDLVVHSADVRMYAAGIDRAMGALAAALAPAEVAG
jgi:2-keto-3-deoxy-L-rhamnonate aldolase RhmA